MLCSWLVLWRVLALHWGQCGWWLNFLGKDLRLHYMWLRGCVWGLLLCSEKDVLSKWKWPPLLLFQVTCPLCLKEKTSPENSDLSMVGADEWLNPVLRCCLLCWAVLCVEVLSLTDVDICTFLYINHYFPLVCVLWKNQSLFEHSSKTKIHWNVMLEKDPP